MWDGVLCEVIPPPGLQWRPQASPSDLAPVSARQSWGPGQAQSSLCTRKPRLSDWVLWQHRSFRNIIPVRKTEQEWVWGNEGWLSPQTLGCSEDDGETGLCLDIDLSGLSWQWPQCPGLAVYSCQSGSPGHPLLATLAMPGGMGPSCCLANVKTSSFKTKHRNWSFETFLLPLVLWYTWSFVYHLRTKSSFFHPIQ